MTYGGKIEITASVYAKITKSVDWSSLLAMIFAASGYSRNRDRGSMDGHADLLDHITDIRGLLSLSVCNETVVPGWIYASYRWRHGVVLCTRISPLSDVSTKLVCTPNASLSPVIEYPSYHRSHALKPVSLL